MHREYIRSTSKWWNGQPRYDTVLLDSNPDLPGVRGMAVACVLLFFSFSFQDVNYPCALVRWYTTFGDGPDGDTRMWIVQPESLEGEAVVSIIHIDCIIRACHLIGIFGKKFIPKILLKDSLDAFKYYYINKYADHHMFRIAI
jgi:hypothetical protein